MQLRPYQVEALESLSSGYREGVRSQLLCAPTGAGKSAMTRYMLARTRKKTLILVHREELRDMISESLADIRHGVIAPGRPTPDAQIMVGMMQTVTRRLDTLPQFEWVISDEAHLAMSDSWARILGHYAMAWHLGMSATPCRLDGIGLGRHFQKIVYGPSIRELTDLGYLSPARVFAPPGAAEFIASKTDDLERAADQIDRPAITGDAIDHMRRLAADRRHAADPGAAARERRHAVSRGRVYRAIRRRLYA